MCSVAGCEGKQYGRTPYCHMHYQRNRLGIPMNKPRRAKGGEGERFLASLIGTKETGCITWPFGRFKDGAGHAHIGGKSIVASRLMCIMAHGDPPFSSAEAAHGCGKGHEACVNPNHLRWATRSENLMDRVAHGAGNKGERSPLSKLTDADVLSIREIYANGGVSQSALGERFGVSQTQIGFIVRGCQWRHLL